MKMITELGVSNSTYYTLIKSGLVKLEDVKPSLDKITEPVVTKCFERIAGETSYKNDKLRVSDSNFDNILLALSVIRSIEKIQHYFTSKLDALEYEATMFEKSLLINKLIRDAIKAGYASKQHAGDEPMYIDRSDEVHTFRYADVKKYENVPFSEFINQVVQIEASIAKQNRKQLRYQSDECLLLVNVYVFYDNIDATITEMVKQDDTRYDELMTLRSAIRRWVEQLNRHISRSAVSIVMDGKGKRSIRLNPTKYELSTTSSLKSTIKNFEYYDELKAIYEHVYVSCRWM